jgi:hypothetical protein
LQLEAGETPCLIGVDPETMIRRIEATLVVEEWAYSEGPRPLSDYDRRWLIRIRNQLRRELRKEGGR